MIDVQELTELAREIAPKIQVGRTISTVKLKKTCPTRIKLFGEFWATDKGKTLWSNPGPAKSALKNALSQLRWYGRYYNFSVSSLCPSSLTNSEKDFLIKEVIKEVMRNAEFVPA